MQSAFLQKIRDKGHHAGHQEGRCEATREATRTTLKTRGLGLTAARSAQLAAEARADLLDEWFVRALTAVRVADVFADPR